MMSRRAKGKGYSVGISGQRLETAPRQGEKGIMIRAGSLALKATRFMMR